MADYGNGRFPLSMFEHLGGNIYLPAATAARFRGFRDDIKAETGVTLRITGDVDGLGGWNGYRPFDRQVAYRKHYGIMASVAGLSSHGGKYQGRDFFAFDIANITDVPWATVARIAAKWGLWVNFVTPKELWHFGDPNPWVSPAVAAGSSSPIAIPTTGVDMFLFYAGTLSPSNAYLATYDGRALKVRPTVGVEATALIAASPQIPRVQLTAAQVIDLCAQGGYTFKAGVGYYDGVASYRP